MSSNENQPSGLSEGLQIPGLVQNQESVEQLSFTINPLTPAPMSAPVYQSDVARPADPGAMSPSISQAGIADMPLFPSTSGGYMSGASSLPGLADFDLPLQPISQAGIADTPISRPVSGSYASGPSSLSGLADFDTAHQPASQDSTEDTKTFQPGFAPYSSGPGSPSNPGGFNQVRQPISQMGLGSAVVPQGIMVRPSTHALLLDSQPEVSQSGETARPDPGTTASRPPVVIRGSNQNVSRSPRPPQGRRPVISIAALILLLVITMGTLFAVSPLGQDVRATFGVQSPESKIIQGTRTNMNLIAQATATAVVHQQNDGVDPTSNGGGPVLSTSSGSLAWPYGYCTYWANLRYHELSGHWVSWHGNADQWVAGARLAGWNVSQKPHVPSIIVLMPGVQGASGVGHVAVVESASGNVAHTSTMNWYVNGGGFGIVSHYDFTAGSGVYFIWA